MKRFTIRAVAITVLALLSLVATTGCSTEQVRLWFAVHAGRDISTAEATRIATEVNSGIVPACDENYWGACVPNNATDVDCVGEGDGPTYVSGPLLVRGWDHYGLDYDGDKVACDTVAPQPPAGPVTMFRDGRREVGYGPYEIKPGTYVTTASGPAVGPCGWNELRGPDAPPYVVEHIWGVEFMEVFDGDLVGTTGGCTWTPAPNTAQPMPDYADGTYRVGHEIQPGYYRSEGGRGLRDYCRWERRSTLTDAPDRVIESNHNAGPQVVHVREGDVAFNSDSCRPWIRIDGPPERFVTIQSNPDEPLFRGGTATWTEAAEPFELSEGGERITARFGHQDVTLSAAKGEQLAVGRYEDVSRYPFNLVEGGPGMNFRQTCNSVSGWFEIHEVSHDEAGVVTSLEATFEHRCSSAEGTLLGHIKM